MMDIETPERNAKTYYEKMREKSEKDLLIDLNAKANAMLGLLETIQEDIMAFYANIPAGIGDYNLKIVAEIPDKTTGNE